MSLRKVAYFSMEIGLKTELPTYSGGLGVLAGDTLKSTADLGLPVVAVSLLYRKGYFKQSIGADGKQSETPVSWDPKSQLALTKHQVTVNVEGKPVTLQAWQYDIKGHGGHIVPTYFLDAAISSNDPYHQTLTDCLYGGDERYRICQETILGMGGVKLLEKIGGDFGTYHMNEGHAAFLTLQLLQNQLQGKALQTATDSDLSAVKKLCMFTTHTPVKAGHDCFSKQLVEKALGSETVAGLTKIGLIKNDSLNMSDLALKFSRFTNGVAKRHGEVSRGMFPQYDICAITNGIHAGTWISPHMAKVLDESVPQWQDDNHFLRYVCETSTDAIGKAHRQAKAELISIVNQHSGKTWDEKVFTIGFARRSATYKRADLIFSDLARLEKLAAKWHGLQIVFAGKAHPMDMGGKQLIKNVYDAMGSLAKSKVSIVYLPNYDMNLGRTITAGVDVWLNNPIKPLEASGTSGMKAALNGVPSLSTLDGWWVEGFVDNITGWEIIDDEDGLKAASEAGENQARAAKNLYTKLEDTILPLYYEKPQAYLEIRRHCIALNGSYFNTQRMVQQYWQMAYAKAAF
jgi:starch phosphorylase